GGQAPGRLARAPARNLTPGDEILRLWRGLGDPHGRRRLRRARRRRERRVLLHVRRLSRQRLSAVGLDRGLDPLLPLPPLLPPLHDRADVLALRTRHLVSTSGERGAHSRTHLMSCTASSGACRQPDVRSRSPAPSGAAPSSSPPRPGQRWAEPRRPAEPPAAAPASPAGGRKDASAP